MLLIDRLYPKTLGSTTNSLETSGFPLEGLCARVHRIKTQEAAFDDCTAWGVAVNQTVSRFIFLNR